MSTVTVYTCAPQFTSALTPSGIPDPWLPPGSNASASSSSGFIPESTYDPATFTSMLVTWFWISVLTIAGPYFIFSLWHWKALFTFWKIPLMELYDGEDMQVGHYVEHRRYVKCWYGWTYTDDFYNGLPHPHREPGYGPPPPRRLRNRSVFTTYFFSLPRTPSPKPPPVIVNPTEVAVQPVAASPVDVTSEPVVANPVEIISEPDAASPVQGTSEPVVANPVEVISEPVVPNPVDISSAPDATSPVEATSEPVVASPAEFTSEPVVASPAEATSEPGVAMEGSGTVRPPRVATPYPRAAMPTSPAVDLNTTATTLMMRAPTPCPVVVGELLPGLYNWNMADCGTVGRRPSPVTVPADPVKVELHRAQGAAPVPFQRMFEEAFVDDMRRRLHWLQHELSPGYRGPDDNPGENFRIVHGPRNPVSRSPYTTDGQTSATGYHYYRGGGVRASKLILARSCSSEEYISKAEVVRPSEAKNEAKDEAEDKAKDKAIDEAKEEAEDEAEDKDEAEDEAEIEPKYDTADEPILASLQEVRRRAAERRGDQTEAVEQHRRVGAELNAWRGDANVGRTGNSSDQSPELLPFIPHPLPLPKGARDPATSPIDTSAYIPRKPAGGDETPDLVTESDVREMLEDVDRSEGRPEEQWWKMIHHMTPQEITRKRWEELQKGRVIRKPGYWKPTLRQRIKRGCDRLVSKDHRGSQLGSRGPWS